MNYNVLAKYGQSVAFGVGALLIIVFFVINATAGLDPALNFILWAAILIFLLALATLVLWALFQTFADLKGSTGGLISIGILLAVFLIFFFISKPDTSGKLAELREINHIGNGLMKGLSAGLLTTGVLFVVALGAFVYSELRNLFK